MSYETVGGEGVRGVGVTVAQGSWYAGDGDTFYHVVVAVPGGEETDGEGWTFKQENTGYYPPKDFFVDAPAEALDTWEAQKAAERAAAAARYEEQVRLDAEREAATPRRGRTVEVVRGRKVPVGTTGEVFWYGESRYGYRSTWRVGFKTADGEKHFTDAYNVQVVTPAGVAA